MWIKYRHGFAHGYGDTGFVEVPEMDELIKNYGGEANKHDLEDLVSEYIEDWDIDIGCSWWSDKYRGFDVEKIDHPPSIWLINKIKRYRSSAKHYVEEANRYQKLLDEVGFITKDDSDIT